MINVCKRKTRADTSNYPNEQNSPVLLGHNVLATRGITLMYRNTKDRTPVDLFAMRGSLSVRSSAASKGCAHAEQKPPLYFWLWCSVSMMGDCGTPTNGHLV